jgi:hypothetical protein
VKVSLELAVIKTISSLIVSGSIATEKVSMLPVARVTPPSKAAPAPVATVIDVAEFEIPEASVVSTLILEYRRVIGFP